MITVIDSMQKRDQLIEWLAEMLACAWAPTPKILPHLLKSDSMHARYYELVHPVVAFGVDILSCLASIRTFEGIDEKAQELMKDTLKESMTIFEESFKKLEDFKKEILNENSIKYDK